MTNASDALPSDLAAAHAMILAERAARLEAEAAAARERAANSSTDALIARLKLEIEKLRRELYGTRSERKARLLDQMEMQLEDLEADATEDELAAEAAARSTSVAAFQRTPYHPQTQGKIERWHQTLKNRILLENYYLPEDLERQVAAFVGHYNHARYHESLGNLTPADVYLELGQAILAERERIKRHTFSQRRLQHQLQAA